MYVIIFKVSVLECMSIKQSEDRGSGKGSAQYGTAYANSDMLEYALYMCQRTLLQI